MTNDIKLFIELRELALKNDPEFIVDWNNSEQKKYFWEYNESDDMLSISSRYETRQKNVYFSDKKQARRILDIFGRDKLIIALT